MRTLNDYFIYGVIDDVSTASTVRVAVPDAGKVIKSLHSTLCDCSFRTARAYITVGLF